MLMHTKTLNSLAQGLQDERKRQGLTREQLASVCNVSTSFIRDVESNPGRCSLERMLQLMQGLGLRLTVSGWQSHKPVDSPDIASSESPAA